MKTLASFDIATDLLVASDTQLTLQFVGQRSMTALAFVLDICVRFNDRSGHDEHFLERSSASSSITRKGC